MVRPVPTLRGWVVGAVGVLALVLAAWAGRVDLLFAGLLLTIAPLAAMIAIAVDRPRLTVARSFSPDSVPVGETVDVRLSVRNHAARPTPGFAWIDGLPEGLARGSMRSFPSLAAATGTGVSRGSETATLRYSARLLRRGAFLIGPLRVTRTDPFGLARCGYDVGDAKLLLVTPRVTPLADGSLAEARGEGAAPELVRHSIPSADEVIPRDYHPGDPLRRVQWRATARLDRLMVREEEQRRNPTSSLLLDTVSARREGSEPFERAVELVASLSTHLLELGYLVTVHETGEKQLSGDYELPGGDGVLIGQLASLEQTPEGEGDFAGRLSLALRAGNRASPVFLILVDGHPAAWRELAPLRRFAEPAIAFLTTAAASEARPWLEEAGWLCVEIGASTSAAEAWRRAAGAQSSEASRV